MLQDIFFALVSSLIVEPAQTEFAARLAQLGAPPVVIQDVSSCVSAAHPVLARVYSEDPVHGAATAIKIWTGMTTYQAVLHAEVPVCKPALEAAQRYTQDNLG